MKRVVKNLALMAYRVAAALGLPSTRAGRRVYEALYIAYKTAVESGSLRRLRAHVKPGSTAIDVGANIGFFTLPFARWTAVGGRVLAIEPEVRNFERLAARLEAAGLRDNVELIQGVAAERSGRYHLALNPNHPGDHRLAAAGIPVEGWSLDDLLAQRPGPPVSFMKIDVQGAELRVINGARKVIEATRPILLIEVEPPVIEATGGSTEALLAAVAELGYAGHIWNHKGTGPPLDVAELLARAHTAEHFDVLYIPIDRD